MESISLDRIEIKQNLVLYHYSVSDGLKLFFKSNVMFLEYEQDMSQVPVSLLTVPFVSCMAGLMWLTNCKVFVDEIDKTFYDSFFRIRRAFQDIFHYIPLKGQLVPSIFRQNEIAESENSLLLFGGGVDCHCSFVRNKKRIGHICNIYGWLSSSQAIDKVDESDCRLTGAFAHRMGVISHHVRSNFASQFNLVEIDRRYRVSYWYCFLHSLAFISISVPICVKEGASRIYIASSFSKGRIDVRCASYITTDSEFRFARNGHVIHDGFELNRQDKVKVLVDYQKSEKTEYPIQACSFNDRNCCKCEKCFRTIIEIVAENGDPRNFGFLVNGSLKDHWERIVKRDIALWGVDKERYYRDLARKRMLENYDIIKDKEFVDWFLNFDFDKAKRDGLKRYYRQNFFSILKRKIRERLHR